ncbi:MAG: hypothetical protein QNJ64_01670 [Crocosphaera sp.]|nr:hypothetical protein [Crocosphaera sp.]
MRIAEIENEYYNRTFHYLLTLLHDIRYIEDLKSQSNIFSLQLQEIEKEVMKDLYDAIELYEKPPNEKVYDDLNDDIKKIIGLKKS